MPDAAIPAGTTGTREADAADATGIGKAVPAGVTVTAGVAVPAGGRDGGIACYAQGGGLGHLTRIRAFLHTVYPGRVATIISSSPFTADPRVIGPHRIVCPPSDLTSPERQIPRRPTPGESLPGQPIRDEPALGQPALGQPVALTRWLAATLRELAPSEFVVDAFPAGLRGELTAGVVPPSTRTVTHLARLLRWEAYRPLLSLAPPTRDAPWTPDASWTPDAPWTPDADTLRFDRTFHVEPLTAEHHDHLAGISATVAPLDLVEPPVAYEVDPAGLADGAWLVVHAGPDPEVAELLGYAGDCAILEGMSPTVVLVSPRRPAWLPAGVAHLAVYPAWPLFPRAERIITAAGCNVVRQTAPYRSHQRMYPFPRRFDDQFARAARTRSGTPSEKSWERR